jgi:hypothetical protein
LTARYNCESALELFIIAIKKAGKIIGVVARQGKVEPTMGKTRAKQGTGNVFADLGLPNPEQELLKARLTLQTRKIIKKRGLTQAQAGEILASSSRTSPH